MSITVIMRFISGEIFHLKIMNFNKSVSISAPQTPHCLVHGC